MRRILALAACALVLTGCSFSFGSTTVSTSELNKKVAGMYTADDPNATVKADCAGPLKGEEGARQDCHMTVGQETADVHIEVTKVDGSDVNFSATPYIPADRVAETIKSSLDQQNINVDTVTCDGELLGKPDESTACTAQPAQGDGKLEVDVTKVDGLLVNFNYKVVS